MECSIRGASQEILLMGFMAVRSENLFWVLILVQSKQMEVAIYAAMHHAMMKEGEAEGRWGKEKARWRKRREILIFQYSYWLWSYQAQWMEFFYIFSKILTKKNIVFKGKTTFSKKEIRSSLYLNY